MKILGRQLLGIIGQINNKDEIITRCKNHIKDEINSYQDLYRKVASRGCINNKKIISYSLSKEEIFSGEFILAAKKPSGNLVIIFGFFSKNGSISASGHYPIAGIFYSMVAKSFSLNQILLEINKNIYINMPDYIHCDTCLLEFDIEKQQLFWWVSDKLPIFAKDKDNKFSFLTNTNQLALGVTNNKNFHPDICNLYYADYLKFYILSPQNFINNKENTQNKILKKACTVLERINKDNDLDKELKKENLITSYLSILVPKKKNFQIKSELYPITDWQIKFRLNAISLRTYDPIPIVIKLLEAIPQLRYKKTDIQIILAETYNNALEHGVLKLDSNLKKGAKGFLAYIDEKEQKLKQLSDGHIIIDISHNSTIEGGSLLIAIEDSGGGFAHEKALQKAPPGNHEYGGRGLMLLSNLCESINYNKIGNRIEVTYCWKYSELPK